MTTPPSEDHRHAGAIGDEPVSLTVDEATERILAAFSALPPVVVSLDEALGLVTAAPVTATLDLPPFANSAMDGYAIRSADTTGASDTAPAVLRVSGHAPAGHPSPDRVEPGCATRIMTGAPVPDGADTVARFEHVDRLADGRIAIPRPILEGENIRPAGEDARRGQRVLAAGTRIRPNEIALLAATGHSHVAVHRRPRVGVLVTGDELVSPGEPLAPGRIWNSNGPMVAAQIRQSGGEPAMLGVVTDAAAAVRARLAGIDDLDLLVTTGGVSVGDFDIVKDVLRAEGRIELWSLRIKPGKPLAFGQVGETAVIGLPGNPVAAAVAFWQFVRPAIRTMLGRGDVQLPQIKAVLLDRVENRGRRRQYVRVRVERDGDDYTARVAGGQGSAMLTSLSRANGLLVVPEHCAVATPGMLMTVQLPDRDDG